MKLADFLYQNSMTPAQLRVMLGVKCRSTVWRYLMGERTPQPPLLQRIIEITDGAVQLHDFLDQSPPRCAVRYRDEAGHTRIALPWSSGRAAAVSQQDVPDSPESRLSPPIKRGLKALEGRAWHTPGGKFLLDGRISDLKRIMQAANETLKAQGKSPIPYPGVAPLEGER